MLSCAHAKTNWNMTRALLQFRYISVKAALPRLFSRTRKKGRSKENETAGERIAKYFRKLTREQKTSLYEMYRIDFEMFGYDASEYLN